MNEFNPLKLIFPALLLLVAIIVVPGSCTVVPPGHRGIAVTLGKVSSDLSPEGIVWKAPFITRIEKYNVQQFRVDGKTACFSADLQTVIVFYSVLMRPSESKAVELYRNYHGEPFASLVQPRLEEILKQITAGYKAEELVKTREKIKVLIVERLRATVGDFVTISDVLITNLDLSDELEKAIETKQVMEQAALAKTYELQKEQKEAEITLVKAKAEAEAVKIKGEALKNSPEVISLEIAKKWDGRSPTSVVVTQGGANILLPLK